jgi:hypothetical protein
MITVKRHTDSSEASMHIRTTLCYIPEDHIHNYHCDDLITYTRCVFKLFRIPDDGQSPETQ